MNPDFWTVRSDLAEGWGVEDIAVRRDVPLDGVRAAVKILRACGELDRMFHREAAE